MMIHIFNLDLVHTVGDGKILRLGFTNGEPEGRLRINVANEDFDPQGCGFIDQEQLDDLITYLQLVRKQMK